MLHLWVRLGGLSAVKGPIVGVWGLADAAELSRAVRASTIAISIAAAVAAAAANHLASACVLGQGQPSSKHPVHAAVSCLVLQAQHHHEYRLADSFMESK